MSTIDSTELEQAIAKAGLQGIAPDTVQMLNRYCQLLWEWNEKINLTRHTTYDLFVERDLLDSLELAKLIAPGE